MVNQLIKLLSRRNQINQSINGNQLEGRDYERKIEEKNEVLDSAIAIAEHLSCRNTNQNDLSRIEKKIAE